MEYVTVLSIAGSDCSGGAGLQADLKTISALGCYATTVVTAVTAQNSCGVKSVFPVPPQMVKAQLDAVAEDLRIDAVKIGMLANEGIISTVADFIESHVFPVVLDPIMVSSSGFSLLDHLAIDLLCKRLLPVSTLVTPNLPEASLLADMVVDNSEAMIIAGKRIVAMGSKAVLIKGGHLREKVMTDVLVANSGKEVSIFKAEKVETRNNHGTGCTLSSAIAAYLARGATLKQAVKSAKEYVSGALAAGKDVETGKGHGSMNHFFNPQKLIIK